MPQMLYDSDSFVVVHDIMNNDEVEAAMVADLPREQVELLIRHVYEIVDKRNDMLVCLHDGMAESFLQVTKGWMVDTPNQAQVEQVLDSYAQLAQIPMALH